MLRFGDDAPRFLVRRDVLPVQLESEEYKGQLARDFAELLSQAFGQ
jgi:hypothetical protein